MIKKDEVFILFQRTTIQNQSGIYILRLFGNDGLIRPDQILSILEEESFANIQIFSNKATGPFQTIEDLGQFCLRLSESFRYPNVFLVSIEDYNKSLEASSNSDDFLNELRSNSHRIENAKAEEKRSFFDRFFK